MSPTYKDPDTGQYTIDPFDRGLVTWRPDDISLDNPESIDYEEVLVAQPPYDSRAKRLCFSCMTIPAVPGSLRCEACNHKHERKVAVQTREQ